MAKQNAVIIKKIKKGGHGHHGGAWKVAYADFVTAMMAFFLLLWLLNATTDAQKRGIADYFSPTLATKSTTSGAGGVLGGRTMNVKGSQANSSAPPGIASPSSQPPDFEETDDEDNGGKTTNPNEQAGNAPGDPNSEKPSAGANDQTTGGDGIKLSPEDKALLSQKAAKPGPQKLTEEEKKAIETMVPNQAVDPDKLTEEQFQALKIAREEKEFERAQYELQQAIQQVPDLKPLAQNLVVERTEEGLRIQLVDQEKNAMFQSGATDMNESGKKLMGLVAQAIARLPNKIAITGHTDATQFQRPGNYGNWELSIDRANASRRALLASGLPADRIANVSGKADTQPLLANDINSPRNRRISMVLLRENATAPKQVPVKP